MEVGEEDKIYIKTKTFQDTLLLEDVKNAMDGYANVR